MLPRVHRVTTGEQFRDAIRKGRRSGSDLLVVHLVLPTPDAPSPDAPSPDAPSPDAPSPDAPSPDAPSPDAPSPDAPSPDAPSPDAPSPDAPSPDAPSPDAPTPDAAADRRDHGHPPTVGFVVSKAVGNAVTRNRVKRRLRHLVIAHLDRLPGGAVLVVRAQPAAAGATSSQLEAALSSTLTRALTRAGR